jgi:membrane protein DedA with SNARE-associated domain
MDAALDFIARWQAWVYPGLALYAAVKSGLLPLFAAAAAATGALDVGLVLLALFGGTAVGEEAKFHAGRWLGPRAAVGRPRVAAAIGRAQALAERWGVAWVLLYRWPKGGRTLGALPLGAAGWSWPRFAPWNLVGSALWAGGLVALGWAGGAALLNALDRWGGAVTFAMLVAMVGWLVLIWRRAPLVTRGTA